MLLVSLAIPALGAAALFLWRPESRRVRNIFILAVTLITSAFTAGCVFTSGAHQLTLLRLTPALTISLDRKSVV